MSINPHDDYEKLAKLLYPSIEASGNVYYGQTRKLTLDEVLKRNSLGFDSHIESFYNDNGYYDSYFCWRLGSLHGSILVDPFVDSITVNNFSVDFIKRILYADSEEIIYDNNLIYAQHWEDSNTLHTSTIPIFGTIFAKYRLDKHSTTITNELNSSSYDSYEFDVEPVLDGIYVTDDFNPVNSIDDNISERHFYISKENGIDYLYIQILTSKDTSKILTFTALKDSKISLSMGQPSDGFRVVEYRVSQGGVFPDTWETYHYDWIVTAAPTGPISLSSGQRIQFRSDIENAVLFNNTEYCLKFVINSGKVFVSGSCMSMCHPDIDESTITSLESYALYGLFSGVENMYGTPMLPNIRKLGVGCYNSMFSNCTSLTVAPKLKSSVTYDTDHIDNSYCYSNMFNGCISLVSPPKMMGYDSTDQNYHSGVGTCHNMFVGCKNLKSSPVIRYKTLDSYSCYQMFSGCSSLKIIQCGAKYILNSATTLWVNNVPSKGTFIKSSANYYSNVNGIPTGWTSITKDDEYFAVHKDPAVGFRIDKHIPNGNYKNDYLVTSGTDSETNGRGYIDSHSNTLGNMERSFDENGTHKMNTYNSDGSFNQEIWGYKSFNSPVKFRNGIYDENISIVASTSDKCDRIIPNISAVDFYGNPTQSFDYISNICTESLPTKCSKISYKNYSDLLVASTSCDGSLNFTTIINDLNGVSHNIEYNIDNYYSAYSEISTKDYNSNKEARVYSSVKPNVNLSLSIGYFQDVDDGSDWWDISLTDSSFSTMYESGIVADESFINITSINNNSVATVKANKVNIDANIVNLNNVTIMPRNHVNDSTITEYNNGGLYILGINLYNSSTSTVLNCGTSIECTGPGSWYAEPQHKRISVKRLKFSGTFVPSTSSYSTDVSLVAINDAPTGIKFMLLSPITLSSNTNNISCALAICTSGE